MTCGGRRLLAESRRVSCKVRNSNLNSPKATVRLAFPDSSTRSAEERKLPCRLKTVLELWPFPVRTCEFANSHLPPPSSDVSDAGIVAPVHYAVVGPKSRR